MNLLANSYSPLRPFFECVVVAIDNAGNAVANANKYPDPGHSGAARFVFLRGVNLWECGIGVFVLIVGVFGHAFDASVSEYAHRMTHSMITYEFAMVMLGISAFVATQAGDRGPLNNKLAQTIVNILALAFGIFCYIVCLKQFMGDETFKVMLPQSLYVLVGRVFPRPGGRSAISIGNLLRIGSTTIITMLWLFAVLLGSLGILKAGGMSDQPTPDWIFGITMGFYYVTLAFILPLFERLDADLSARWTR